MKIRAFLLSILCLMVLPLTSCTASDHKYISDKDVLVIGITADYKPMNFLDTEGNWTGFDTEFAEAVCENLGLEAKFETIFWDKRVDELKSKKIDCIWNGYTINKIDEVDFTDAYALNSQVFVTKLENKENYKTVESINGLTVAVEKGGASKNIINELELNVEMLEYSSQKEALIAVSDGRADGCIVDKVIYNSLVHSDLAFSVYLNTENFGIGFREGSDMVELVNEQIAVLKRNGTLSRLADKYDLELAY